MLAEQDDRLLLKHPFYQVIDIGKMVIESFPPQATEICDLPNGDLLQRLLAHECFQGGGQFLLCRFRGRVFHAYFSSGESENGRDTILL